MFLKRIKRIFSGGQKAQPRPTPWYTGPPTFPTARARPLDLGSTPIHVPAPPATPGSVDAPPVRAPHLPLNDPGAEVLEDTRPIKPVKQDTRPTQAIDSSTSILRPLGHYDHLFPPAQPGDEDYFEVAAPDATTAAEDEETPTPPRNLPQ